MWQPTQDEIEQIKLINGEQGTAKDGYYRTMLPLLLEHLEIYCNNKFTPPDIPGGVRIFMAKAIQHNCQKAGLKSRSMGTVSYSYDLEFPGSMYMYLAPYRRLKFHALR
ncbi:hypothetical protein [Bacillus sp. REN10]|uniref:hypothetical protein n=1 Tax=Bacillus sp. REN10 TaxID=2782541 RepID=UPI00193B34CD|nr:hypothetical protein [Bacillus sp. REN10]